MLSEQQIQKLEERKLDVELMSRMGFETVSRGGSEWLVAKYIREGQVLNRKYRTLSVDKRFTQDPGGTKMVWNEDILRDQTLASLPIVITEGELDAVAVIQSGWPRVVSVPEGAPAKELGGATDSPKYAFIADLMKLIPPTTPIILATDNDAPGQNLQRDLQVRLGGPRCKFVNYPKSRDGSKRLKDMNEVLMVYGPKGVTETLARAQWLGRTGVYSMESLPEEPDKEKYSLHMGDEVDQCAKLRRGDFWVITGVPGHGKSSFVDDMLCRVAVAHNLRTCVASFEKNPKTDHRRDLRKWHIAHFRDTQLDLPWTRLEVAEADEFIERAFRFVVPAPEDNATLEWLCEQFAAAVIQHGCDIVVVDPWNEIEHERGPDESLTEYTGRCIKALKRFARTFNVTVIVVAHPSKLKLQDELSLYSISDSAHWANKTDVGILVARDYEKQNVTVDFAKIRNDDIGVAGKVVGLFDRPTRHFRFSGQL